MVLVSSLSYAQNNNIKSSTDTCINKRYLVNCSKSINELSYFWKIDSLGQSGFRAYTYDFFLYCNKDSVTKEYLIEKLGKPNRITGDHLGTVLYGYICFDGPYISAHVDVYAGELIILFFVFRANEKYVSDIGLNDN